MGRRLAPAVGADFAFRGGGLSSATEKRRRRSSVTPPLSIRFGKELALPGDDAFDALLTVAQCALSGRASILYWIDGDLTVIEMRHSSFPMALSQRYHAGLTRNDPLNSERLCRLGRRFAVLTHECAGTPQTTTAPYLDLLSDYGFGDAVDMILWHGDVPLLGVGVLRSAGEPAFDAGAIPVAQALQRHLECNLPHSPQLRRRVARRLMTHCFGLTDREHDVVEMIADGATNQDISDSLRIRLPTVKTHVKNTFDKLGVDTRTALVSLYLQPELWRRSRV